MAKNHTVGVRTYSESVLPRLSEVVQKNEKILKKITTRLVRDVSEGRALLVFGSGHSSIFPLELYHRAGGVSFVIPLVADYLLPTAGPPVVRMLERTVGIATPLLDRASPKPGEMLWLASQSGINAAAVDLAIRARARGLKTVAFTSLVHSRSVKSRHPSGKRLFEVCDWTVDLGGVPGDALIPLSASTGSTNAGPFSTLSAVILAHSILVAAAAKLEASGKRCVYTSVNTPVGEARNRKLEQAAQKRDALLKSNI